MQHRPTKLAKVEDAKKDIICMGRRQTAGMQAQLEIRRMSLEQNSNFQPVNLYKTTVHYKISRGSPSIRLPSVNLGMIYQSTVCGWSNAPGWVLNKSEVDIVLGILSPIPPLHTNIS